MIGGSNAYNMASGSGGGEGPLFKLRASCDGHKGDVRALAPTAVPEGKYCSFTLCFAICLKLAALQVQSLRRCL